MPVNVLHGDCRDVLPRLPAESFDCIVTSPPYWGLRDYGVANQIGLEPTLDSYVETMRDVARELWRVLKPCGTFWLNLGDCYAGSWGNQGRKPERGTQRPINGGMLTPVLDGRYPTSGSNTGSAARTPGLKPKDLCMVPHRVALTLQADGWWVRSAVVWHKPNPMPESVTDRPTSAYEMVFLLTKAASYFYDAEAIAEPSDTAGKILGFTSVQSDAIGVAPHGNQKPENYRKLRGPTRNARNVWTIAPQPYKGAHFATMAPALAERCIKAGSSERGCCPACGKPWKRQTETEYRRHEKWFGAKQGARRSRGSAGTAYNEPIGTKTIGWRPTCVCPTHEPVPAKILDPFGGSGTTGMVARRLGRDVTLIDLNDAYLPMQRERIQLGK